MKNKVFITITLLCLGVTSIAQVVIGTDNPDTDTPNAAAILEIKSTDKGILLPRLESSKISDLDNVKGLMVYCTDCDGNKGVLKINNGTEWVDYVPSSGGSFSGNVGIGASSPDSRLHVVSDKSTIMKLNRGNNVMGFEISDTASGGFGLYDHAAEAIQWYAKGGNVGIGTTSPDRPVHLKSNGTRNYFKSETTVDNYSHESGFEVKTPSANWLINSHGGTNSLNFYDNKNIAERMRIDANGNVGIGTSSPSYLVHVNALAATDPSYIVASSSDKFIVAMGSQNSPGVGQEAFIGTLSNNDFKLKTNDTERMRISNNGNVGIGTTNPQEKLHVNGNVAIQAGESNTSYLDFVQNSDPKIPVSRIQMDQIDESNNTLIFHTRGSGSLSERMRIDENGNVGIGTTTPLAKLHLKTGPAMEGGWNRVLTVEAVHPAIQLKGSSTAKKSAWIEYDDAGQTAGLTLRVGGTNDDISTANRAFKIFNNGNVTIGTISASSEKLYVAGNAKITGNLDANSFSNNSDERWKKDIKTLDNSLDKITALRGVRYEWNHDEFPDKDFSEGTQIGVIAQEIESVFPEMVHTDKEGYKSVSYSNLVAPLIEAIKEQQKQIETLQKEIEKLKKQ